MRVKESGSDPTKTPMDTQESQAGEIAVTETDTALQGAPNDIPDPEAQMMSPKCLKLRIPNDNYMIRCSTSSPASKGTTGA